MATLIIKNTAHDGYRRTGVAFARGETRLPMAQFTPEQLVALENDPYLFVTVVDEDDGEADPLDATAPVDPVAPKAPAKGRGGKATADKASAPVASDVTPVTDAPPAE